jgi:hypothetical protein
VQLLINEFIYADSLYALNIAGARAEPYPIQKVNDSLIFGQSPARRPGFIIGKARHNRAKRERRNHHQCDNCNRSAPLCTEGAFHYY